jgi:hypothetical protein
MKLEKDTWYIAHNKVDVFHFGLAIAGSVITTGQPFLQKFETEEAMATKLNSLTGDSEYYTKYLESQKEEDELED